MLGKKGTILREPVFCLQCKRYTAHIIGSQTKIDEKIKETDINENFSNDDNLSTFSTGFSEIRSSTTIQIFSQVIFCGLCKSTSLRNVTINQNSDTPENVDILPKRPEIDSKLKSILKNDIYELYEEILFDYINSYRFSCGASIRSLIELICKREGYKEAVVNDIIPEYIKEDEEKQRVKILKERYEIEFKAIPVTTKEATSLNFNEKKKIEIRANLSKQVHKLKKVIRERRPLSNNNFDILDMVVQWGNDNIHDYKVPKSEELESVINIINFLFHVLYIDDYEENRFKSSEAKFKSYR